MLFHRTSIHDAWLIQPEPHRDARGSFSRAFCRHEFAELGIDFEVAQANIAHTLHAGVIRGLHYQDPPYDDKKLVRCTAGSIHDVIMDTRPTSPTYGSVYQVRLDSEQRWSLFIPGGVAHGYQVLEDATDVIYLTDRQYVPGLEKGVRYSDPALGAHWPHAPRDITDRDLAWPLIEAPSPKRD